MTFDSLHLYFTYATSTHTETSTKRRAAREPTYRSSTGGETSTESIATRPQSLMGTEREPSTALRATRTQSSEYIIAGLEGLAQSLIVHV